MNKKGGMEMDTDIVITIDRPGLERFSWGVHNGTALRIVESGITERSTQVSLSSTHIHKPMIRNRKKE